MKIEHTSDRFVVCTNDSATQEYTIGANMNPLESTMLWEGSSFQFIGRRRPSGRHIISDWMRDVVHAGRTLVSFSGEDPDEPSSVLTRRDMVDGKMVITMQLQGVAASRTMKRADSA